MGNYEEVNLNDITIGEINSLMPTFGIFNNVNIIERKYYRFDDKICEVTLYTDINNTVEKNIENINHMLEKKRLMKNFGF